MAVHCSLSVDLQPLPDCRFLETKSQSLAAALLRFWAEHCLLGDSQEGSPKHVALSTLSPVISRKSHRPFLSEFS